MIKTVKLTPPLTDQDVIQLSIGDTVLVSGVIYTARDAAHKRLVDMLAAGQPSSTSRRWTASGPNSGKAITVAALIRWEISAPAPPVAPRYTALYSCMAAMTSAERLPLPIIAFKPSLIRVGA